MIPDKGGNASGEKDFLQVRANLYNKKKSVYNWTSEISPSRQEEKVEVRRDKRLT